MFLCNSAYKTLMSEKDCDSQSKNLIDVEESCEIHSQFLELHLLSDIHKSKLFLEWDFQDAMKFLMLQRAE
jgi:hypothetical protein